MNVWADRVTSASELIALLDRYSDKDAVQGAAGSLSANVFIGSPFEWKRKGRWEAPRQAGGVYAIQLLADAPAEESGWRAWVERGRAPAPAEEPAVPYGSTAMDAASDFAAALAARASAHRRMLLIGGAVALAVALALAVASGKAGE